MQNSLQEKWIFLTYWHEGWYIITLTKSHIKVSLQINIRLYTKNISAFAFNKLDICGMHDWSLILRRHHKCKLENQIVDIYHINSIRFPFHRSKRFVTEENHNIRLKSDKKKCNQKKAGVQYLFHLLFQFFCSLCDLTGNKKKRIYVRREGEDEEIIKKFGKYLLSSTYIWSSTNNDEWMVLGPWCWLGSTLGWILFHKYIEILAPNIWILYWLDQ